jgi:uncharacterized protein (DUF58 family)
VTPDALLQIHDLELVARVTVEGALSGLHRSPFHGYSAEFSQYRHYRAGDDLKYIDWKLFARTDRIYTKQFRETTNVRLQILLDASASMAFAGDGSVSKLAYARVLAGALAHLMTTQGDAPGLTVYDEQVRTYIGSRPGRSHLRAVLTTLANTRAHGSTEAAPAVRRAVDLLRSRALIVVISDLYDDDGAVEGELKRAARMGHDVSVFHTLSREELDWPFNVDLEVEDSESGRRVLMSSSQADGYRARVNAFVAGWRDRCAAENILYALARTDADPGRVLREHLLQRSARASR